MDEIAKMSRRDRAELFRIVSSGAREQLGMNVSPGVIEKDFWVCWLMRSLFALPLARPVGGEPRLLFKGGTSLSKVFGAIKRFSEDVDVSVEPRELSVDLAPLKDPTLSNTKRKQVGKSLTEACATHVREKIRPALLDSISAVLGDEPWLPEGRPEDDQLVLLFPYPGAVEADQSLLAEVRLEFGARADLHPWKTMAVCPYVWDVRPDVFASDAARASVPVPTLNAERTFWEKATLLHVENLRAKQESAEEPAAWQRISRHGYDLAMLAAAGIADSAIPDEALFRRVCDTKHLWFRSGHSDYDELSRGDVQIVPRLGLQKVFVRDYEAMRPMFFMEPPAIEDLLAQLQVLERRIHEGE